MEIRENLGPEYDKIHYMKFPINNNIFGNNISIYICECQYAQLTLFQIMSMKEFSNEFLVKWYPVKNSSQFYLYSVGYT